jgi:hypothetical protein
MFTDITLALERQVDEIPAKSESASQFIVIGSRSVRSFLLTVSFSTFGSSDARSGFDVPTRMSRRLSDSQTC